MEVENMEELIKIEQKGNIKIVTLNRPKALNSISSQLARDFHKVLGEIKFDMETRCLIITGEGRSFTLAEQQELVRLCAKGNRELLRLQRAALK